MGSDGRREAEEAEELVEGKDDNVEDKPDQKGKEAEHKVKGEMALNSNISKLCVRDKYILV